MAERLTAWPLSGRGGIGWSKWLAGRQADGQAGTQTRETDRQEDWKNNRQTLKERQRERQRGRHAGRAAERLPDRHALLVAGQAVGVGRRHGDSKCLWRRGRAR